MVDPLPPRLVAESFFQIAAAASYKKVVMSDGKIAIK